MSEVDSIDKYENGGILQNRSCTDCPMILIWMLYMLGLGGLVAFSLIKGNPYHVILPDNFAGDICGLANTPLSDYKFDFIPMPNKPKYSICTKSCPAIGSIVCNNVVEVTNSVSQANHVFSHTVEEVAAGKAAVTACATSCTSADQAINSRFRTALAKAAENKCFPVVYGTQSLFYRCLPTISQDNSILNSSGTTLESVKSLTAQFGGYSYVSFGFAELQQTWKAIAVGIGASVIISLFWIALLKCILKPIVYFTLFLLFALLACIGYFAKYYGDNLNNNLLPGETVTRDQSRTWDAIQYASWICIALYLIALMWFAKRIRIAIAVMKVGLQAFTNNKSIVIIKILVACVACGIMCLCVIFGFYIESLGDVTINDIVTTTQQAASQWFATTNGVDPATFGTSTSQTIPTKVFNQSIYSIGLHAYNLLGMLWLAYGSVSFGFFVQSLVLVTWYFSVPTVKLTKTSDESAISKYTPSGALCKSISLVSTKHLGTLLFGSFLIALINFIRFVFLYIQENFLQRFQQSETGKILLCIMNCCIAYIERCIRVITQNAFVLSSITSKSFCPSAIEGISMLLNNSARYLVVTVISSAIYAALKITIVCCNLGVTWVLLTYVPLLTDHRPVESGLFPMVVVAVMTFVLASLFIGVYESCTDTIFMCVLYDESKLNGQFLSLELAKLLDTMERIEKSRQEYSEQIRNKDIEYN